MRMRQPPVLNRRPFAMPMIKTFIPKKLQPWLYLLCAVIFQMVNTVYMGSMQQMVGDLGIMREDVSFIFLCGVVGVAMPFQHFFMGLTIAGFVRNGLVSAIGGGLYGFSLRRHVADNLVSGLPFTVFDSMLMAIKQLYDVTCLIGCTFMLLLMLWHVQPVRSTLKRLPYWNAIGRAMRKELGKD